MNIIKNLCCNGSGYIGGSTMTVIASQCPEIMIKVAYINQGRISLWNHEDLDQLPIYEPGELAARGVLLMGQFYNIDGTKKHNEDLELPYSDLSKFEIYSQ